MASTRMFLLLCVAVLTTYTQIPKLTHANSQVEDIITDILALVNKLKEVLTDAIIAALDTLGRLLDSVFNEAANVEKRLKQTLTEIVQDLIKAIDELEQKAAEAGIDTAICIGHSVADLTALPEKFLKNTTSCLNEIVVVAKAEINKTIEDIQSTANVVANYTLKFIKIVQTLLPIIAQTIINCTSLPLIKEIACIGQITAEISSSIVSLPLKIMSEVVSSTQLITTLVTSLAGCELGAVEGLTFAGGAILANVTECVNYLLNHQRCINHNI